VGEPPVTFPDMGAPKAGCLCSFPFCILRLPRPKPIGRRRVRRSIRNPHPALRPCSGRPEHGRGAALLPTPSPSTTYATLRSSDASSLRAYSAEAAASAAKAGSTSAPCRNPPFSHLTLPNSVLYSSWSFRGLRTAQCGCSPLLLGTFLRPDPGAGPGSADGGAGGRPNQVLDSNPLLFVRHLVRHSPASRPP
jgi:hypothetical protein